MHIDPRLILFSNISVLIPLSLGLAWWINRRVSRHMALAWLAAVAGVGLVTALLKIWLYACHAQVWDIHSPSGTASFGTIVYGGLAVVMATSRQGWRRSGVFVLALLWIASLAMCLVVNHVHTLQEVIAGLVFGGIGVLFFATVYRADARPSAVWFLPCALVLAALALYPPAHLSLEPLLHQLGHWSADQAPICAGAVLPVSGGSP